MLVKLPHSLAAVTVLVAGATVAVAVHRLARIVAERAWFDAQLRLVQETVHGPNELLEQVWGVWPQDLTTEQKRAQLLINALVGNTELGYEQDVLTSEHVREVARELLSTTVGRTYWAQARNDRLRTAHGRRARTFPKIIDSAQA